MERAKLTGKGITNIMVNLLCNKLFILAPLYFRQSTGFSSVIVTTIVFTITFAIWNMYCESAANPENVLLRKKYSGKFLVAIISVISVFITAVTIYQYSIELKASYFNNTPLWFITITFLTTMLLSLKYKAGTVGVASAIFVPAIYSIALVLVIISLTKNDLYNLFPLTDTNFNTFTKQIILMLSMLFELVFMYFLPEIMQNKSEIRKIGNNVIIRSYICYLIIGTVFSVVLPELSKGFYEPFFKIIKQAHLGNITVKFDSVFLILYCISASIYISSMLLLLYKITEISFSRITTCIAKPLLTAIICLAAIIPAVSEYMFNIMSKYYFILCIVTFAYPTIIIIYSKVMKWKQKKQ